MLKRMEVKVATGKINKNKMEKIYQKEIYMSKVGEREVLKQQRVPKRDEILWDQLRDVVIVFWVRCILFCQFEAKAPEFDALFIIQCTLYRGGGWRG